MNGYMASADPYMPLYGEDAVRLMFHTGEFHARIRTHGYQGFYE